MSIDIQNKDGRIQYNKVTICENESSSVDSGTDGVNSDIGALADFSDDDEETRIEQPSGCRIPGCQCEGRIEFMEWGSDDMTETDFFLNVFIQHTWYIHKHFIIISI